MDLDAKLAGVGLQRRSIDDARAAWLRLHERYGKRATVIDRYELEALTRGIPASDLSPLDRQALAREVFRDRDPAFEVLGEVRGTDPIEVVPYDPAWLERFESWRRRLAEALGRAAERIEHVGSTSVPGLAAKPIVDIQVSVADIEDEDAFLPAVEALGPKLRSRETGHFYFRPPLPLPREVQVHVCEAGSKWERDHLLFRDFLRADAQAREAYAQVKGEMARVYPDDRIAYNEGKSGVILDLMEEAEHWAKIAGWGLYP